MIISFGILIPMIAVFVYYFGEFDQMVKNLKEEGVQKKGVVVRIAQTTRGDVIYYDFVVNDVTYSGASGKTHNHDFQLGDSILIICLPQNPDSNIPRFQLE